MNAHTKPQKNNAKAASKFGAPTGVTTGPIIGSRKIYVAAPEHPEMRVPFREVVLTTDSQYVRQGITEWMPGWLRRGWKTAGGEPVKNRDLWERLHAAASRHAVDWRWVKGHAGHPENERVDQLARAQALKFRQSTELAG